HLDDTLSRACMYAAVAGGAFVGLLCLVPFDPIEIGSGRGLVTLVAYEIGATVPFFFSGLVVSLALRSAAEEVDRLYFWDLLGAGAGCASAVALMNLVGPPGAALGACAAFAAAGAAFRGFRTSRAAAFVALCFTASAFVGERVPLRPAASKHLPHYIAVDGMVS